MIIDVYVTKKQGRYVVDDVLDPVEQGHIDCLIVV